MTQPPATEDRILDALAGVPTFSQLDDKSRRKLAKLCTLKSFAAGDVLFEEGVMGLSLFVVISGKVERHKGSDDRKVGMGTVTAGGVLGALALLDGQPRSATAVAMEATECLLVTRDGFETLVKKDPQIAWCLTPALAGQIRELQGKAVETELSREEAPSPAKADEAPAKVAAAEAEEEAADEDGEDEDDEPSELESALFKMMRMQFGLIAGAAKGMTETARVMEKFLDSMAEETEIKTNEDWGDMVGKIPDAMVTATRKAMDESEKVPEEIVDAYHRYSDSEN
jgi:CRP-like cAMP-binding protein